jgi:hypothetical protein
MRIANYQTAYGKTFGELDMQVNQFIKVGWQPFGNPFISEKPGGGNRDGWLACQAMVMDDASLRKIREETSAEVRELLDSGAEVKRVTTAD